MTISKESVERSFSRAASTYEQFSFFQKQSVNDFAAFIHSNCSVFPCRILESGCGTGLLTAQLRGIFPAASILSTDLSAGMINFCRDRFAGDGKLIFQQHDFDSPYDICGVDLAVSSLSLQWSSDLSAAFSNLARALAPDGRLFVTLPLASSLSEVKELFRGTGAVFRGVPLPTEKQIADALFSDFREVTLTVRSYREEYPSFHDFLTSMRLNGTSGGNAGTPVSVLKQLLRKDITTSFSTTYHVAMVAASRRNA